MVDKGMVAGLRALKVVVSLFWANSDPSTAAGRSEGASRLLLGARHDQGLGMGARRGFRRVNKTPRKPDFLHRIAAPYGAEGKSGIQRRGNPVFGTHRRLAPHRLWRRDAINQHMSRRAGGCAGGRGLTSDPGCAIPRCIAAILTCDRKGAFRDRAGFVRRCRLIGKR